MYRLHAVGVSGATRGGGKRVRPTARFGVNQAEGEEGRGRGKRQTHCRVWCEPGRGGGGKRPGQGSDPLQGLVWV